MGNFVLKKFIRQFSKLDNLGTVKIITVDSSHMLGLTVA